MQLKIELQKNIEEPVVIIQCKEKDALIERLIAAFQIIDRQLTVICKGSVTTIDLSDILYIESVDRKCFIYTRDRVFETSDKLYELERQLSAFLFVQINKSCLVNMNHIDSIKSYIDRRLLLTMSNKEQLIASRQYAAEIKTMLGVK